MGTRREAGAPRAGTFGADPLAPTDYGGHYVRTHGTTN